MDIVCVRAAHDLEIRVCTVGLESIPWSGVPILRGLDDIPIEHGSQMLLRKVFGRHRVIEVDDCEAQARKY